MRNIVHLSDLHYGGDELLDRSFETIVVNLLKLIKNPVHYVVLVSGDLVNNANDGMHKFVKSRLDCLKDAGFIVLVVPGNHDYGSGIWGKKKFVTEFKMTFFEDKDVQYPKIDIVTDANEPDNPAEAIAFFGLDSMAEELGLLDSLWAQGELGKAQLSRLNSALNQPDIINCGKRILYMHHHPFDPTFLHQLKDSKQLQHLIKTHINSGTTIDALLYGHNHQGASHFGMWGIPRCYDGSSSTGKKKNKAQPILQRVIDLKRSPETDYNGNFHQPH